VKLAEALDDRTGFRRFCGFSALECTPERTAFVRFRKELVARGLDGKLFEEVRRQPKAKAVTVKTGTLVDATIIASSSESDGEARWVKHKNRKAIHGFKAHVSADAVDTAIVEELAVTPGNANDGRAGGEALPDNPGEVYAGSAYRGPSFARAVKARGGVPRVAVTGIWGRDEEEALAKLRAWNAAIQRVRRRIEKIFGTSKRCYGLRLDALDGACQSRASSQADGHRLQHETNRQYPGSSVRNTPKRVAISAVEALHVCAPEQKQNLTLPQTRPRTGLLTPSALNCGF
jgi:IS5 family transposase